MGSHNWDAPRSAWSSSDLLDVVTVWGGPELSQKKIHQFTAPCEEPCCLSPQQGMPAHSLLVAPPLASGLHQQGFVHHLRHLPWVWQQQSHLILQLGQSSLLSISSWPVAPSLSQGSLLEPLATSTFWYRQRLASHFTGQPVPTLRSGLRLVRSVIG